jgi:hypothetical protein
MADLPTNTGCVPVSIEGKDLLLTPLTPEGLATVASYIAQSKQPVSMYSKVLSTIDKVPAEHQFRMLESAMKCDHEENMRDRFGEVNIPKSAFFDDDVMAMMLSLTAADKQPEYTLERCKEIAKRVTGPVLLGKMFRCFPMDWEKKGLGSLGLSAPGRDSTGQPSSPISTDKPNTDSTSAESTKLLTSK